MQGPLYENPPNESLPDAGEGPSFLEEPFGGEPFANEPFTGSAAERTSPWRAWIRSLRHWRRGSIKVERAPDAWYRSLDLQDRQRLLARGAILALPVADPTVDELIGRWRRQAPFDDDRWFRERLARDGFDAHEFPRLLGSCGQVERSLPEKMAWRRLEKTYVRAAAEVDTGPDPAALWVEPLLGLEVDRALDSVRERLVSDPEGPLPAATSARRRLLVTGCRRALERLASWMLEDPAAPNLDDPAQIVDVFQRLPVLARQLRQRTRSAVAHGIEVLERLARDWPELRRTLLPEGRPGILESLELRLGLGRRGGRAVTRLTFSDGRRLLYKPWSLAAEEQVGRLLDWLVEKGREGSGSAVFEGLRLPRVLDRDGYGWMEWVDGSRPSEASTSSRDPGERIHPSLAAEHRAPSRKAPAHQAGAWMAILRLLGGSWDDSDWLVEESTGALVPVDLSHLFQQPFEGVRQEPWRVSPCPWTPSAGPAADAGSETRIFERAFERSYRALVDLRPALLDIEGPLEPFRNIPFRLVPRSRGRYRRLLRESLSPRFLHDAAERELCFDRLWQEVPERPHLARLVFQEKRQLWRGDLPELEYRPGSLHLWSPDGSRLDDIFERTAMWSLAERADALSEADLRRCLAPVEG